MDDLNFSRYGLLLPRNKHYDMDLSAIQQQFGLTNHTRRNIFSGLAAGVENLFESGVKRITLGGSFISRTREPRDADIAWWYEPEIDWSILDEVFQLPYRRATRAKFLLDQKVDGLRDIPYKETHEYFLRCNTRMPVGFQDVGIIRIHL